MPERGIPREIKGAAMNLLHKRCLRIDQAVQLQHAMNLFDALAGIGDVFEDSLNDDAIKRTVGEPKTMAIARELRSRADYDVRFDRLNRRIREQTVHSLAHHPPSDDQNPWVIACLQQEVMELREVPRGSRTDPRRRKNPPETLFPDCRLSCRPVVAGGEDAPIVVDQDGHAIDDWKMPSTRVPHAFEPPFN